MITINLLAPGKRRPPAPTPGTALAVGSLLAMAVVFGIVTVILSSRGVMLHRQVASVNRELDSLRPVAQEVSRLEALVRNLEQRQNALRTLLATQLPASQSLDAIKAVIPSDVWLVNVTTQQSGRNVLFDGYTFSYRSVARFMIALRDSDRFRNIDLTSTGKDKVGDREVVKFQVTGELVPGAAKTKARAPEAPEALLGDPAGPRAASAAGGSR
jgi:Tfp pilus assembly protein PilN